MRDPSRLTIGPDQLGHDLALQDDVWHGNEWNTAPGPKQAPLDSTDQRCIVNGYLRRADQGRLQSCRAGFDDGSIGREQKFHRTIAQYPDIWRQTRARFAGEPSSNDGTNPNRPIGLEQCG